MLESVALLEYLAQGQARLRASVLDGLGVEEHCPLDVLGCAVAEEVAVSLQAHDLVLLELLVGQLVLVISAAGWELGLATELDRGLVELALCLFLQTYFGFQSNLIQILSVPVLLHPFLNVIQLVVYIEYIFIPCPVTSRVALWHETLSLDDSSDTTDLLTETFKLDLDVLLDEAFL